MDNLTYEQAYTQLSNNIVFLIFYKKDGNIRVMLATKNEGMAMLANRLMPVPSRYIREGKDTGNISVIDLETKERRSFNIDRLVTFHSFGSINTELQYVQIYNEYVKYKQEYLAELEKTMQTTETEFNTPFENNQV